jgi:hypothetical protein
VHDRSETYARCTRALQEDRERPGAEAIFDQALTNALAAIVARRWPGEEMRGRQVKSAAACLEVVEQHGAEIEAGTFELEDLDPPPRGFVLGDEPAPTIVRVAVLREAIEITQPPRHARVHEPQPLGEEHIDALSVLNVDASLQVSFADFDLDEFEQRVGLADSVEIARARQYLDLLSLEELERREAVDYIGDYTEVDDDERIEPADCPVCGLQALVPSGFDSYVGEFAWGTCVACSYAKSYEVADFEGRDEAIDRAVNDPRS